ncbi:ParB N-terminal domain-containing protein [Marivibrio halodurans]|uniref:ParB N-terminal domain-containing protein n=1 Tax=Marivibrio halodurans TaxID=2039722 RepID=A0A8J7SMX1_9PROT|nr:ParB N-terminal domain-containing protein [Marivibrio halodurans]MBP5857256.1 ParB N-terminal domain-containing protein [Marivibrio halodurans]
MNTKPVVHMIALADIDVRDRLRPADQASVEALARDIDRRGLRVPIEVAGQLRGDKKYRLVSGLHRITAFQSLGREDIPAFIVSGNLLELRRDELLENLTRNELSKLERAQFVADLKRVYLELHPEAAHGGDRRSDDFQDANDGDLKPWYDVIAERSQRAARTIQREAAIGERLDRDVADTLRASPIADNQKELESLARFSPEIQRQLAGVIASGGARSVTAAHRALSGAPATGEGEERDPVARLVDGFMRLGKRDQDRFLNNIGARREVDE